MISEIDFMNHFDKLSESEQISLISDLKQRQKKETNKPPGAPATGDTIAADSFNE